MPRVAPRRIVTSVTVPGWRITRVVHGHGLTGRLVPVVVGLVETDAGDVMVALRVGDVGMPVFLPLRPAAELIVNVRATLDDLFELTGERIGGDE